VYLVANLVILIDKRVRYSYVGKVKNRSSDQIISSKWRYHLWNAYLPCDYHWLR